MGTLCTPYRSSPIGAPLTRHRGWVIGFVSPYMINPDAGNLGGKVGFVFFGFGVPLCVAFWFLIPETMGLTFEDVSILPDPTFFLPSLFLVTLMLWDDG